MSAAMLEELLDMKCREFVTVQSAGEWTREQINGDALLLRQFILANAELIAMVQRTKKPWAAHTPVDVERVAVDITFPVGALTASMEAASG